MGDLLQRILEEPGWVVLAVVGVVVLLEDALFVGFVVPGEAVAILGGVAAHRGHVPLWLMMTTVVVAAVVGDSIGYLVGRRLGPRLVDVRALRRHRTRIDGAQALIARRGGIAVLLGRWVAFLRALMPALAGAARMPYGTFLAWNVVGGVSWGIVMVLVGYVAGASFAAVEQRLGRDVALVLALVVVVALVIWSVRRRQHPSGRSTGHDTPPH
ncbi:DedA family protein [Cellulomonas sp. P22]|uniref:DedA family protein n=1 Tax=Cellulomonas sp. P22 TaxID=3373189 RepID=UPI0037980032